MRPADQGVCSGVGSVRAANRHGVTNAAAALAGTTPAGAPRAFLGCSWSDPPTHTPQVCDLRFLPIPTNTSLLQQR